MDAFSNPSIACRLTANDPPSSHIQNTLTPTLLHLLFFAASVNNPGCFPISLVLVEGGPLVVTSSASQTHAKCNRWNRPKIIPIIFLFRRNRVHVSIHAGKAVDFLSETQSCFCMDSLTHPPDSCFCLLNHAPFLITGNQMLTHVLRCPLLPGVGACWV